MPIRTILALALLAAAHIPAAAAAGCPAPVYTQKSPDQITDWYERYISPFRAYAGMADNPRPTKEQIEARVGTMEEVNHRTLADSLLFEALVQQIAAHYARSPDFKGLDSKVAEKIYRPGPSLDFTALCIDTRSLSSPDDTFAITLFGVANSDCERMGLRGLVFTNTLINGAVEGQCRPDDVYYRKLIIPVAVGTNTVTFLCSKDSYGCYGR